MPDAPDTTPLTEAEVIRTLWSRFWAKDTWLAGAEILDAYRVFPRLVVAGYLAMWIDLIRWCEVNPDKASGMQWLVSAITGALAAVLGFYMNSGRTWGNK